jgi:hypothetical protein
MVIDTQEFADNIKAVIVDEKRHDCYEFAVEHANLMAIHIYGKKPVDLLSRVRPREDPEVTTYRLENWEATTKAAADKAVHVVSKIFNPTLYSIRWKNQNSTIKEFEDYMMYYYPDYNSIMNYNKDVLLRKMLCDPNALIVIKPSRIPQDSSERPDPIAVIYGCENVWYKDRDHYLVFLNQEETDKRVYFYFEYYDRNEYVYFRTYYDASDRAVTIEEIEKYTHNFNEVPAWHLRGNSVSMNNGQIVFESFFAAALPNWNLAVIHESDLLGAYITHMHPQKYEITEECAYEFPWEGRTYKCYHGIIKYPRLKESGVDDYIRMDCPKCGGSGQIAGKSPYGIYQYNKSKLDDFTSSMKPVDYIHVPTEATRMLEERTREMIHKGLWAINMDVEDKVGEVQSGVAKVIDRSAQYDTLSNIATVVYDVHTANEFYFVNKYRYAVEANSKRQSIDENLPEINKPNSFDVASAAELINNFKAAKDSGLDRNFLVSKQVEILTRDFSTNPDMKKYNVALLKLDPLPGLSIEDIDLEITKGRVRKVDGVIHDNLKPFMDRAISEDASFLERNQQEQLEVFEGYANEILESEKPKVDMTVLDDDIAA